MHSGDTVSIGEDGIIGFAAWARDFLTCSVFRRMTVSMGIASKVGTVISLFNFFSFYRLKNSSCFCFGVSFASCPSNGGRMWEWLFESLGEVLHGVAVPDVFSRGVGRSIWLWMLLAFILLMFYLIIFPYMSVPSNLRSCLLSAQHISFTCPIASYFETKRFQLNSYYSKLTFE